MTGQTPRSVSSKLLSIIEVFSVSEPSLTLSEISRRTGLPLATTYRFMGEWVAWGGLVRLPTGKYSLGTKLWEIGVQSSDLQLLRNAAFPFLEDLLTETRQHTHLAILEGFDALYVEKISARNSTLAVARVGRRLPLHATGVGLVLLANAGKDFIDAYLEKPLKKYTPNTIIDPSVIRRRLATIKTSDVARVDEELHVGVISIASPVRGKTGKTVAAISVVVPVAHPGERGLHPMVRIAGLGISRVLGFRGNK